MLFSHKTSRHTPGGYGVHWYILQQVKGVVVVYLHVGHEDGILTVFIHPLRHLPGVWDSQ